MNRRQMIRLAHENPEIRHRVLPILRATDRVASMMEAMILKEAGKGLPISKLMKYAETGIYIVSAFRNQYSRKENKRRNAELKQQLLSAGVPESKIVLLTSEWVEDGYDAPRPEQSFAVLMPVPWRFALNLSNEYDQDGFVWSNRGYPLALYEPSAGKATFAVDKKLGVEIAISQERDRYSKGRGGSFDLGFQWDYPLDWEGTNPITYEDVKMSDLFWAN